MTRFAVHRRLTGATLALLVQAVFFALLLRSLTRPPVAIPENLAQELTLILPRLRVAQPPSAPARASQPSGALDVPLPIVPFPPNAAAPFAAPPDLSRLGQSIFGCAPETYSSLTPERRVLCPRPGEGIAMLDGPQLLGTPLRIEDQAFWEKLEARNKPFEIPCTHTQTADLGHGVKIPMIMFDATTCGHTPPDTPVPSYMLPN